MDVGIDMHSEMDKLVIMDHYNYPHNKVDCCPDNYFEELGYNPSCGDKVYLYLKINDDQTIDIKWSGTGCSICCASSSMASEELNGLTKEEALNKINQFEQMITGHEVNIEIFDEARALAGLNQFPSRFKCGFLSWGTIRAMLKK